MKTQKYCFFDRLFFSESYLNSLENGVNHPDTKGKKTLYLNRRHFKKKSFVDESGFINWIDYKKDKLVFDGDVIIDGNIDENMLKWQIPAVQFYGIDVTGNLIIGKGAGLETKTGEFIVGGDIISGGNIFATRAIICGGKIEAAFSIYAGGEILVSKTITAGGEIKSGDGIIKENCEVDIDKERELRNKPVAFPKRAYTYKN